MKKTILATVVLSAGIFFLSGTANAAAIKEGSWTMTTNIHMDGMDNEMAQAQQDMENMSPAERAMMEKMMGGMKMKMGAQGGGMGMSMTRTQCITNDNPVPKGDNQEDCQQTHSMRGNTVHFDVVCADGHSSGDVTYKNDTMKGTIKSTQTEKGKETTSTIDLSGQYVGPCDQNAANVSSRANHPSAQGLSDEKRLAIKEKELDLKKKELELKQKEQELESASNNGKNKSNSKSTLENVNDTVNTTNNVKNIFGGVRSLLGR